MKKVLLCLLISTIVLTGCASSSKNDKGETNSTSENNVTESVGNESDTANSTDAKDTIENKKIESTNEEIENTASEESDVSTSSQYKVEENIPTEYKSALRKAESYSETMNMSKAGIYDQLTSEYGEKFTAEAAQYAIDNLQADWNKNALEKAKLY